jgi:adenylate cyclase
MIGATRARQTSWRVRVGVDLGPVVAGVTGRRGFACDLRGDPVNTAARVTGPGWPK